MVRIICYVETREAILSREFNSFEECAQWIREVRKANGNKIKRVGIHG